MSTNTEYWPKLIGAARGLDKLPACPECLRKADPDRPPPLAFARRGECEGCALHVARAIEQVVLDWRFEHDLLKTLAVRLASAFRRYRVSQGSLRNIFKNWEEHLARHEAGSEAHPQEIRSERMAEDREAAKAFWEAVKELDQEVPDEEVRKCRNSASASGSSAMSTP